jgi:hypothetical protein
MLGIRELGDDNMILETLFFILCVAVIVALIYTYGVPFLKDNFNSSHEPHLQFA